MTIDPILTRLRTPWKQAGDAFLAIALGVASLLLYLQTLAPSVVAQFDDSLEFALVFQRLAIAHPTGYPLYSLLGGLIILTAKQNVAWAANLLSAIAGAFTVALVYLAVRQISRRRLPALLGAAALAVSAVFWSQSVITEVYTLNSAFVAALLWLALRWARQPLAAVTPFSLLLIGPRSEPARPGSPERIREDPSPDAGSPQQAEESSMEPPPRPESPEQRGHPLAAARLRDGARRILASLRQVVRRLHTVYRRFFPAVPPARRLQPHPLTYALAAFYGLSLTHHRTMLLLAPALLLFAFLVEKRLFSRAALLGPEHPERPRWRQALGRPWALLAVCFLFPLLLYLYLPLRGHVGSLDGAYVNTWSGFWRWVTTGGYGAFLSQNPLARDLDAAFYTRLFWQQFGPVGLALAAVGLIGLLRRPRLLALTGLAFFAYTGFAVLYRVPDVEVFFIPAFLITAVWIGLGLDHAAELLRPRGPSLALRRLLVSCLLLLVLSAILQPLAIAIRTYPGLDQSQRWIVHDYGQYLLEQPLPQGSTVVGLLGEMTLLRYLQEATGRRTDIQTVAADGEPERRSAVETALQEGRAVYITRLLPGLAGDDALDAVTGLIEVNGDKQILIRVSEPDSVVPIVSNPLQSEPVPGLQLLGYDLMEHQAHWQAWARLRLWWRAPEGLTEPLKISARLVDAGGQQVSAADAEPVGGTYPTPAWRPGEVVADAYEIPLPSGLPPGEYGVLVIVYDPATGRERSRVEPGIVHLAGNPACPPRRVLESSVSRTVYARFGAVELLGFIAADPARIYPAGSELPVTLLWQAEARPAGSWSASFWLESSETWLLDQVALGEQYTTGHWLDGQVVRQLADLRLPQELPPGGYRLKMRVLCNGKPIPWGRGLLPRGSDLDLGMVRVDR